MSNKPGFSVSDLENGAKNLHYTPHKDSPKAAFGDAPADIEALVTLYNQHEGDLDRM